MTLDVPDELVGSAGDQQVDVIMETEYPVDVVARFHEDKRFRGDTDGCRGIPQDPEEHAYGLGGFATSFECDPVAGFQAQGHDLRDHVRARFEDHPEHPDGAADLEQGEPIVQIEFGHDITDGIGQTDDVAYPVDHPVDLGIVYREPLEHRLRDLARIHQHLPVGEVLRISLEDLRPMGVQRFRHGFQGGILDLRGDG